VVLFSDTQIFALRQSETAGQQMPLRAGKHSWRKPHTVTIDNNLWKRTISGVYSITSSSPLCSADAADVPAPGQMPGWAEKAGETETAGQKPEHVIAGAVRSGARVFIHSGKMAVMDPRQA
jgi:hypothetical protein